MQNTVFTKAHFLCLFISYKVCLKQNFKDNVKWWTEIMEYTEYWILYSKDRREIFMKQSVDEYR